MHRARWNRPSCLVMLAVATLLLAALVWLAIGDPLRTPNPMTVTKESPTYDTDVPSQPAPDRR